MMSLICRYLLKLNCPRVIGLAMNGPTGYFDGMDQNSVSNDPTSYSKLKTGKKILFERVVD